MSERKKAHAALAESERRFRNIFDSTRVAIAQLDWSRLAGIVETLRSSGIQDFHAYFDAHPRALRQARRGIRIVEANEVTLRLLGSPGHVRPTATLDDILPEDDRSFPESLLALVRGEPAFEGEAEVRTLAGGRVPVLFNLAFPPRGGSYDCVLVSAVDITERKEAQEALLAAQAELARAARVEALGELTAALAHEVNQPLAAVTTSGEAALRWLRRDPPALEEVAASLARVVANGRRAGEIVFRIHGFLAKRPMRREWFSLPELIEEAISLLERELAQGGVRVRREFVPGLPRIYGERIRLQQAIINLMTNGLQAMLDVAIATRLLTVRVRLESDVEMLVQVLDTGVGLTPESQRRLFEPFFTTKENGMGLGLAISRSTIEAHGGRMWASRREDGPGTSIACTVPITTPGVE